VGGFPLEEIIEAHRYMDSNQQFGKIVVTVWEEIGVRWNTCHELVRRDPYHRSAIRSRSSMRACNSNTRFVRA
jgi:hypothetical protein